MTNPLLSEPEISHLISEVDRFIHSRLSILPERVYDLVTPSLASGKRIRGLLVLLTGLHEGNVKDPLIPVAAACELLHYATLVHDDIIDGHQERRGYPAVYKETSSGAAVLTADTILSISLSILTETKNLQVIDGMVRTLGLITRAELKVHLQDRDFSFSREAYMAWINDKTASLFSTSAFIGAVVAGADEERVRLYTEIGKVMGIAFQIRDDILDYCDRSLLGRKPGVDLSSGLITLPLICYHEVHGMTFELEQWMHDTTNFTFVQKLVEEVVSSGSLARAQEEAVQLANAADAMITRLPPGRMQDHLSELCWYAVSRDR